MPGAGTAQSSGRAPTRGGGARHFCSGLAGWRQRRAPATTAFLAPGARWKRGSTSHALTRRGVGGWLRLCVDEVKRGRKSHISHCSTFRLFVVDIVLP